MKSGSFRSATAAAIVAGSMAVLAGCGSGVTGTYTSATGLATLDLKSGGKASLAMMGESEDCTYDVDGKKINLMCKGDKSVWGIHEDGSITGPGFIGTLKKSK